MMFACVDTGMDQEELNEMFTEYADKPSVFDNKEALTTNWNPDKILHRDDQINELASILAPALKGEDPSNVFIYGSVGTGKTLIARHVTGELGSVAQNQEADLDVVYVNCKMKKVSDTEYRLLAELAREMGEEVPNTGLSTDEVYSRFFDALKDQESVVIVVLDEIDALVKKVGDDFLYNLTRINDDLDDTRVSILGISNDVSFTDYMDSRVESSLCEEEMIFPPYNALELSEILEHRTSEGLKDGILKDGVISKVSALTASEHGDARKALNLLRVAGELAERGNEQTIAADHVDRAQEEIERNKIVETIRGQPKQSRLVLYTILKMLEDDDTEQVATGEVYSRYEEICSEAGESCITQRRVSDLISELDMLGVIKAKVISKGAYGRTRQISVDHSSKIQRQLKNMVEDRFYLA